MLKQANGDTWRQTMIDGVSAAVKMVESLAALRLTTSKHGDLDYPLEKPLSGRFAGLNLRDHYV